MILTGAEHIDVNTLSQQECDHLLVALPSSFHQWGVALVVDLKQTQKGIGKPDAKGCTALHLGTCILSFHAPDIENVNMFCNTRCRQSIADNVQKTEPVTSDSLGIKINVYSSFSVHVSEK